MAAKHYRYRSAVTGRYVSAEFARRHPNETAREAVKTFRRESK